MPGTKIDAVLPPPRAPGQHGSRSSASTRCPVGKGAAGWWRWVRSGHPRLCPLTQGCPHSHRVSLPPQPHGGVIRARQAKLARCGGAIRAWTCQRPRGRGCLQPSHLARGGARGGGGCHPLSHSHGHGASPGARTGSAARHRGSVRALGHGRGSPGPAPGHQGRAAPGAAGPRVSQIPRSPPVVPLPARDAASTQSCPWHRCLPGPWGHGAPGAATGHRTGGGGAGRGVSDLSRPPRVPPGRGWRPGVPRARRPPPAAGLGSGAVPPPRRPHLP